MSTRRFPFKRPDGGISVVEIIGPRLKNESEKDWINRIMARTLCEAEKRHGPCVQLPECDVADLPTKAFRDAWRADSEGKIHIDPMERGKIIKARARPDPKQKEIDGLKARLTKLENKPGEQ